MEDYRFAFKDSSDKFMACYIAGGLDCVSQVPLTLQVGLSANFLKICHESWEAISDRTTARNSNIDCDANDPT